MVANTQVTEQGKKRLTKAEREALKQQTPMQHAPESNPAGNVQSQMPSVESKAPSATQATEERTALENLAKTQGKADGVKVATAANASEQCKREIVFAEAEKLNGDQIPAYLDGLQLGLVESGLGEGTAKKIKYEFAAIFKAIPVTVELTTKSKVEQEGKLVDVEETSAWDKTRLQAESNNWATLVLNARNMARKASTGAQESQGGGRGDRQKPAIRDDVFTKIQADLMTRTTGAQALAMLDDAIARIGFYYRKDLVTGLAFCADEIDMLRNIENTILAKIKARDAGKLVAPQPKLEEKPATSNIETPAPMQQQQIAA